MSAQVKLTKYLFIFLIIILFTGCNLFLGSPGNSEAVGESALIHIRIETFSDLHARTLYPDFDLEIDSYQIFCSGPGDGLEEYVISENELTVGPVVPGSWVVNITAVNTAGDVVGEGADTISTVQAATTEVLIVIHPSTGSGTVDLSITWPAGYVETPAAEAALKRIDTDEENPLIFNIENTAAVYLNSEIESGSYLLFLRLFENESAIWGTVSGVVVIKDNTTRYHFELSADDIKYPPEPPTELDIVDTGVGTVTLRWSDSSLVEEGFIIERRNSIETEFNQIALLESEAVGNSMETIYIDNSAEAGATYIYRVKAYNNWGDSNFSNEISVYIPDGYNVQGLIESNTVWSSGDYYYVTGDIQIGQAVRLTIEPGVKIFFSGDFNISISGGLVARGSEESPIIFTYDSENPAPGSWGPVRFESTISDAVIDEAGEYVSGSILEYSHISSGRGLYITDSFPLIKSTTIDHCYSETGAALSLVWNEQGSDGELIVADSVISDNLCTGVSVYAVDDALPAVSIANSKIIDNWDSDVAAFTISGGNVEIHHSEVRDNTGVKAVLLDKTDSFQFVGNYMYNPSCA
jgi:hypothetical protein